MRRLFSFLLYATLTAAVLCWLAVLMLPWLT